QQPMNPVPPVMNSRAPCNSSRKGRMCSTTWSRSAARVCVIPAWFSKSLPIQVVPNITGRLEVVQHFQADEAGFTEIGVGETNGLEAGFEFPDGGGQIVEGLVLGRQFAEEGKIDSVGA